MELVANRLVPNDLNFLQNVKRIKVAEDIPSQFLPTIYETLCYIWETWLYEFDIQIVNKLRNGAMQRDRNRQNHAKVIQKLNSCWLYS